MNASRERFRSSVRRYRRLRTGAWVAALLLLQAPAPSRTLPPIPGEALESIKPSGLRKHLEFLASDELGGRYTLSQGNRIAARYLATQLEACGYRGPAAGGAGRDQAFFQKIAFKIDSLDPSKSVLTLSRKSETLMFNPGEHFRVSQAVSANVTGELIYMGHGIASPSRKINDYEGLSVRGRIVVLLPGFPPNWEGRRASFREFGVFPAAEQGAIAAIVLPSKPVSDAWATGRANYGPERRVMARAEGTSFRSSIPQVTVSPVVADLILAGSGRDLAAVHASLESRQAPSIQLKSEWTVSLRLEVRTRQEESQNVVGILDGADPKLREEYVAISAHFDHVEARDGVVYNGADDDGSGTASVLEIARALGLVRPRRSVLVVFHTGEEMGLLGSRYFTEIEPLVPLSKIVAVLNIDMIGRSRQPGDPNPRNAELTDPNSVYVIGSGRISSQLREMNDYTAAELGKVKLDYRYEQNDTRSFYTRSDHYNYARRGIPVAFFFTGEHEDYHAPTDDVEKIDFDKMARIAQMIYATAWRVANLDERLTIDKKMAN